MEDFSNVKLDKSFKFNDENVKWLIHNISFGKSAQKNPDLYCSHYHFGPNWCLFSPRWLFLYSVQNVHFEVAIHKSATWKLELHFENVISPNLGDLAKQSQDFANNDPLRNLQYNLFSEALLKHLWHKLPNDKSSLDYQWEDWRRPNYCLIFRPNQPLNTLGDVLELYPQFYQFIINQLKGDLPTLLQGLKEFIH